MTARATHKTECLNPNTGRRMSIDTTTHALFSNAIQQVLQHQNPLTFTALVKGVDDQFKKQKTPFNGAVAWYTITVKNNMHSRGLLDVFTQKGKKLHRLAK